ncbi:MAG: MBL fold metallo-hydrolase [Zetaproteobacteria bacterium]|nr:MBL fold metallo-hydrolase [Pseudobdellovibrionaceae bacterium]|tara:strand:+ start:553 stop:1206 length:654 start_codon:yes stop_codon:yes gene_type:complete
MTDIKATNIIRETFPVGPLQCNCTILGNKTTGKAIVVDPGGNIDQIMATLQKHKLKVIQILHTHAHLDHFLASGKLKELTGAPLALHKDDQSLWNQLEIQCGMFGIPYEPVPEPDHWLEHEEDIDCCDGKALHTPGHSPGSMSFYFEKHNILIAGDTLFKGSIGRTDLWGGDPRVIAASIKDQLYTLDESAIVVTGHGPDTSIGWEMRNNPFVNGLS